MLRCGPKAMKVRRKILLPALAGRGTASRSVEIGDRARRNLCGHRQDLHAPRGAAVPVPKPQGGKEPFPDGN
jgi:hypothetical protein